MAIKTTKVTGKTFENKEVRLDGREYHDCTIRNCTIKYGGGKTGLHGNRISGCQFDFDGSAARTIQFLADLGREDGAGRTLVAATLRSIFPWFRG